MFHVEHWGTRRTEFVSCHCENLAGNTDVFPLCIPDREDWKRNPTRIRLKCHLALHYYLLGSAGSDEEYAGGGQGDQGGGGPIEFGSKFLGSVDLGLADEQGQAAAGGEKAGGGGEGGLEAFDGTQGHHLGCGGEVCGTAGEYIDICQCKAADHLPQKSRLLVVRLDQGEVDGGRPEFEGQAGKAGPGADVNTVVGRRSSVVSGEQVAGGKQRLSEVAGDDLLGIADGGEVDAGVPAEKYIDVRRYIIQLGGRELGWCGQERLQQFRDAGGIHVTADCSRWGMGWFANGGKVTSKV